MSNYVIGDVQGCYSALNKLLETIQFDPQADTLWFTGDLVNRGAESLLTLRFIKNLGDKHKIVLGNHDLHLLSLAHEAHPGWQEDTLADILSAPDRDELAAWLIKKPLVYHDATLGFTMAHAGLAPSWDLNTALALSKEVETVLQSAEAPYFFQHMYGNEPSLWSPTLTGFDRLRCITNYFTRMRYCHADGRLELTSKGRPFKSDLIPWFKVANRVNADLKILFGHWAALAGVTDTPNTFALDTGCIWGYDLTAMRLEDEKRLCVSCR